jgi:hypothetical protein
MASASLHLAAEVTVKRRSTVVEWCLALEQHLDIYDVSSGAVHCMLSCLMFEILFSLLLCCSI